VTKLFIIAGNYYQFREYQRKGYSDDILLYQNLVYVSSIETLKGVRQPRGKFIGTWYKREDMLVILYQLSAAGSLNEEKRKELARYLSSIPKG
jgi:hypothetical protein